MAEQNQSAKKPEIITKHCCVPGCKSDDTTALLFQFPTSNSPMRQAWLKSLELSEAQLAESSSEPVYYVCYGHFDPEHFQRPHVYRKQLTSKAIPTHRIAKPSDSKITLYAKVKGGDEAKKYICKLDDLPFYSAAAVAKHFLEDHEIDTRNNYVECKECHKTFSVRSMPSLRRHLERRHTHLCDICGKAFSTKPHVARHMIQVHFEDDRVECPKCKKVLASPSSLQQHMLLHGSRKKYVCDQCGMRFAQAAGLCGHRRQMHNWPLIRKKTRQPEKVKTGDQAGEDSEDGEDEPVTD